MEQNIEKVIVTKEAFTAVGIKWEGTFAEAGAGGIRTVQEEMNQRLQEIKHVTRPDVLLGLNYHITGDSFVHHAVVEVEKVENLPEGMVSISIPTLTYAKCEHKRGENIQQSYTNIFNWIDSLGYTLNKEYVTHFEEYPMGQDPYSNDPEFAILIPINK